MFKKKRIICLFFVILSPLFHQCIPINNSKSLAPPINSAKHVIHSLKKRIASVSEDSSKNDDYHEIDDDLKDDDTRFDTTLQNNENNSISDINNNDDDDDDDRSQIGHKLLIIMIDGFRSDYVKRDHKALKGFARIAKQGIYAKEVDPVIPAVSYPNYYTIATGLWPDEHGFVDDSFRSSKTGDIFEPYPHDNASNEHWWMTAEPIWIGAEKKRIKSALFNWPGCEVQSSNVKRRPQPFICVPYDGFLGKKKEAIALRQWFERVVEDFRQEKYRLAMIHYETIEYVGHKYGPQSRITKQAVRDIDSAIYDLQDAITKNDLNDEVNLYIVSDHGLISTSHFRPIILGNIIDMNDIEITFSEGSHVQIQAEIGKHKKVLDTLFKSKTKGLNIYERNSLPERFHLRNNHNLLPIFLTADDGFYIEVDNDDELEAGEDGYDVDFIDEMEVIMYASGPDIQRSEMINEMDQVDHYNVFCHLLNIEPKPNNGSIAIARRILRKFEDVDEDEDKSESKEEDDDDNNKNDKDGDNDGENSGASLKFSFSQLVVFFILIYV